MSELFESLIKKIFQYDRNHPDRLITRESQILEFKENFQIKADNLDKYGKTIAAFANNKGGSLVFGVKNRPRQAIGMFNNGELFEQYDDAQLSAYLNSKFSPDLHWERYCFEDGSKQFGIIHVLESLSKPVIAKSNGGQYIKEGEIYYRYKACSEKIKYPELLRILEIRRLNEQKLWMNHFQKIASIGVDKAGIFNPSDGNISGKSGTFIIDKKLLPDLQFIHEGEFKEVTGAPAIKIVGSAEILATGTVKGERTIVQEKNIQGDHIIDCFLKQKTVQNPLIYIQQICYEMSGHYPVYYYAKQAQLSKHSLLEYINNQNSKKQGQKRLLNRINDQDKNLFLEIKESNSNAFKDRIKYREFLISKEQLQPNSGQEVLRIAEVMRSLSQDEIDKDYLFPLIEKMNDFCYKEKNNSLTSNLRKAICYLDKVLYCDLYDY